MAKDKEDLTEEELAALLVIEEEYEIFKDLFGI